MVCLVAGPRCCCMCRYTKLVGQFVEPKLYLNVMSCIPCVGALFRSVPPGSMFYSTRTYKYVLYCTRTYQPRLADACTDLPLHSPRCEYGNVMHHEQTYTPEVITVHKLLKLFKFLFSPNSTVSGMHIYTMLYLSGASDIDTALATLGDLYCLPTAYRTLPQCCILTMPGTPIQAMKWAMKCTRPRP